MAGEHHASATYGSQCVTTSAPLNPVYEHGAGGGHFLILNRPELAVVASEEAITGHRSTVSLRPAGLPEFATGQAESGHDGHGRGEGQHRDLGRKVLQEQAAAGDADGHA